MAGTRPACWNDHPNGGVFPFRKSRSKGDHPPEGDAEMAATPTPVRPLSSRPGPRPRTTPWAPHIQEDQNASPEMQAALAQRICALPAVEERATTLSAPGARAIWLRDNLPLGPRDSFLGYLGDWPPSPLGREPAHRLAPRAGEGSDQRGLGRGTPSGSRGNGTTQRRDALRASRRS